MDFGVEFDFEAMLTDQVVHDNAQAAHAVYQMLGIEPDLKRLPPRKYLNALNFNPAEPTEDERGEFERRVQQQMVCLEKVECTETSLIGTVRVANVGFWKRVTIRYTRNNWRTFEDVEASYIDPELKEESESLCSASSIEKSDGEGEHDATVVCEGEKVYRPKRATEQFQFELPVPKDFGVGSRVEFAICYEVNLQTFWNQNGSNYIFECSTKDVNPRHVESAKWWHHFV